MIYILFIILVLLFIILFNMDKYDMTSPAKVFVFGFLFQSMWAVAYARKWELGLHVNTFLTITLGIIEFVLVCFIVKMFFNKKYKEVRQKKHLDLIKIDNWKKILYLVSISIFTVVYLYYIVKAVDGNFGSLSGIKEAIAKYDNYAKFTDNFDLVRMPFLISNIRIAIIASGYWFGYVILYNFIIDKKVKPIEIIILIVTVVLSIMNGSRTPAFMMIVALISYYLILKFKKSNYKEKIDFKVVRNIAIIGLVFIVTFISFGSLLGRKSQRKPLDYLAIYIGAEVKNLDLFLQEKDIIEKNTIFASQTLKPVVDTIGQKIGFEGYERYRLDLPFRSVNGMGLGNVYTTFYPYIYDFGYVGVVVFVFFMALISQVVYEFIRKTKLSSVPQISILMYGIIFGCLLLSFFSNKFYENIVTVNFLKNIVVWLLCNWFFTKLDIKKIKENK